MGKKKTGRTGRLGLLSVKERTLIDILEQRKKLVAEKQMISKKKTKTSKDKQRIKEITKQLNYSSKRFSKFTVELLKRLDASREDLQIILLSSSLRELRKKYSKYFRKPFVDGDYDNYPLTGFFDDLGKPQPFEYDETNPISNYSTWKVHTVGSTKARKYWLSVKEELKNTVKDTTEPTYAIIGIKGHWNRIVDSKKSNGKMVNVLEDINVDRKSTV